MKNAYFRPGLNKYSTPSIWYLPIISFTLSLNSESVESCSFSTFSRIFSKSRILRSGISSFLVVLVVERIRDLSRRTLSAFAAAGDTSPGIIPMPQPFCRSLVVSEVSFFRAAPILHLTSWLIRCGAGYVVVAK